MPFSVRSHLCPFSARSHLRPFSARRHLRPFSARRQLRPFSWGLGTYCTPHQHPVSVWQPHGSTMAHLPTPAAPFSPYPHRRPLPPINVTTDGTFPSAASYSELAFPTDALLPTTASLSSHNAWTWTGHD